MSFRFYAVYNSFLFPYLLLKSRGELVLGPWSQHVSYPFPCYLRPCMCTHHCLLARAFQLKVSHQRKLTHAQFCLTWFGLYTTWQQEQGNLVLGIEGWDWNQVSALLHFSECLFLVCSLKRREKKHLSCWVFFPSYSKFSLHDCLFAWLLSSQALSQNSKNGVLFRFSLNFVRIQIHWVHIPLIENISL